MDESIQVQLWPTVVSVSKSSQKRNGGCSEHGALGSVVPASGAVRLGSPASAASMSAGMPASSGASLAIGASVGCGVSVASGVCALASERTKPPSVESSPLGRLVSSGLTPTPLASGDVRYLS